MIRNCITSFIIPAVMKSDNANLCYDAPGDFHPCSVFRFTVPLLLFFTLFKMFNMHVRNIGEKM